MKSGRTWKMVLLGLGVVTLVGAIVGYQFVIRSFIHQYYQGEYRPTAIASADLGSPPPAHRLGDVPWLSESTFLCQSLSARMLAAQQGAPPARQVVDYFMGFTWGATAIPRQTGFFPGQDPEVGLLRAAPYLGFDRRYLTTNDRAEFLLALRTLVAKGKAVRVALDRSVLLEQREVVPHSVVVIGYDEANVEYYDPTCEDASRCAPGERPVGTPGLKAPVDRFLMAIESQALVFQYPWKYQLVAFDPIDGAKPDPSRLLAENAQALIGRKTAGPSTGSVAVSDTATSLSRHGDSVLSPALLRGVRLAAQVRRENAETLLFLFPDRPALAKATELLDGSAKHYQLAADALDAKHLEIAATELAEAAKSDHSAGMAILGSVDGGS